MAVRSLRVAVPANRIRAVCTGFIDALGAELHAYDPTGPSLVIRAGLTPT